MNKTKTNGRINLVFTFLDNLSMSMTLFSVCQPELVWASKIAEGCLAENPAKRWSMSQISTALKAGINAMGKPALPKVSDPLREETPVKNSHASPEVSNGGIQSVDEWVEVDTNSPWSVVSVASTLSDFCRVTSRILMVRGKFH